MFESVEIGRGGVVLIAVMVGLVAMVVIPTLSAEDSTPWQESLRPYITNAKVVTPQVIMGGELKDGALAQMKEAGVALVIDTRTPAEGTDEEKEAVEDAGLSYLNIPISGRVSSQMVEILADALASQSQKPVVIHCRSGRRVGMLWNAYLKHTRQPGAVECEEC